MRRFLLTSLFVFALALASCGGGVDFSSHYSDSGLIPENFLPSDAGMVVSYSLREADQYTAVQAIETKLGDVGRLSRTFSDQFDTTFKGVGLQYDRDLQPAFGDQFRFVYAARMVGSDTSTSTPETFSVITLKDSGRLESVLKVLVDAKQVEEKAVDGTTVYVNNDQGFYATIHEDLLLVASTADNLMAMVKQDASSSLWASDDYQSALEEVKANQVLYAMLFPAHYLGGVQVPGVFSLSDIPSIVDRQTLVIRAEATGLKFQAYVNANKSKAKEADISFDQIPHSAPYLFEEVPADHLLGYFESFGLKQSLEEADKLGSGDTLTALRDSARTYLGMDFDQDIMTFLDKGYAIALHKNGEGLFPGLTVYIDVSSTPDKAKELVDKVDGQITGLMAVFEASLPGAFMKDTVDMDGSTLNRIKIDLSAVPRTVDSPLPAAFTDSPIELIYGIKGDRLVLSTAAVWESTGTSVISDSTLYKDLNGQLEGVDEGLILFDAQELADFIANLRALREQLNLQASEEAGTLEDFLKGFEGLLAKSHSNAYDSLFSGTLQLAK